MFGDTDGVGTDNYTEGMQGSDPTDDSDGAPPPDPEPAPEPEIVTMEFYFENTGNGFS